MAFPLLFKPLMVSQAQDNPVMPPSYTGQWTDGGMTNNLPLRAFPKRGTRTLHPRTVAFALDPPKWSPSGNTVLTNFARLIREYSRVTLDLPYETQVELDTDLAQIVRLSSPGLGTFDIVFNPQVVNPAIDKGREEVERHFTKLKPALSPVIVEWSRRALHWPDFAVDGGLFETIARAQFRSRFPVVSPEELLFDPFNDDKTTPSGKQCTVDIIVGRYPDRPDTWDLVEAKAQPAATGRLPAVEDEWRCPGQQDKSREDQR
jgi:hypothetical protein